MKPLSEYQKRPLLALFTDIDDTLTSHGKLGPLSYNALWELSRSGISIIPVTGRPAGWCEMIARFWPVHGVIGENGAFYFRYVEPNMQRTYYDTAILENPKKLKKIQEDVLKEIPGAGIASDQFCRLTDLAIDYCEDVPPLNAESVDNIVKIFERHGATAKVSSIHVNGWYGEHDKLKMCLRYLKDELNLDREKAKECCAFAGDSPNDEPMFEFFPLSFAVANFEKFKTQVKSLPSYISGSEGGEGFNQIAKAL